MTSNRADKNDFGDEKKTVPICIRRGNLSNHLAAFTFAETLTFSIAAGLFNEIMSFLNDFADFDLWLTRAAVR